MRKLSAHRPRSIGNVLNAEQRSKVAFFQIEHLENVTTPSGEMPLVTMTAKNTDLANPDTDVAICIGKLPAFKSSGKRLAFSHDLFMWGDSFYIRACSTTNGDLAYFKNGAYILMKVDLDNEEEFAGAISEKDYF